MTFFSCENNRSSFPHQVLSAQLLYSLCVYVYAFYLLLVFEMIVAARFVWTGKRRMVGEHSRDETEGTGFNGMRIVWILARVLPVTIT